MKKILIYFLTKKGREAYEAVEEAGKKESGINKRIMKRIARDSIISRDPLTVEINIKVPRLAIASEFDKQIIKGLEAQGAKLDKDFNLKVVY